MNFGKYKRQYFMPPTPTYDWVKKEYIDKAPIWCSVDSVSYTHLPAGARVGGYFHACPQVGKHCDYAAIQVGKRWKCGYGS